MIKLLLGLLSLGVLAYVGMGLFLYLYQRQLLYYPTPALPHADLQSVRIQNQGHELHAWKVGPINARAVLYFGGNAEDVGNNADAFRNTLPELTIYLSEYRGYGRSEGKPSEQGLYSDALAWYDHLATMHDHVMVIGRSLGSGVASYVAANREPVGLILITPFDSIRDLAKGFYPLYPMSVLLRDPFDSLSRAKRIASPCLILLAEHDTVVPRNHSERLIDALSASQVKVKVNTLYETDHITVAAVPAYWNAMASFIRQTPVASSSRRGLTRP
ncbi:MAG: dienelactone hydrolase family protein [Chromatiales bacterium]|nr:dienelactone hydrolase family protein [Chromatiales bacterium]